MAKKTKSQTGSDRGRKLAADAGRGKSKSGGESKKDRPVARGSGTKAGSSKQRKG